MTVISKLIPFAALTPVIICGLAASAVDVHPGRQDIPRLIGEVTFGTAGFEPGVAAEWTFNAEPRLMVRPEVLISQDGRPGVGVSLDWGLNFIGLPAGQDLTVGPRVIYHNADDWGWGADLLAIYSVDIVPSTPGHHYVEVLGTLGAIEDRRDSDNRNTRVAASIGLAYGYQF
jgi:hypothetical protein